MTFLSQTPNKLLLKNLESLKHSLEEFKVLRKEIYLHCTHGYGRTKLSNSNFEKFLSLTATTRNWKTVNTLLDIANNQIVL